MTADPTERPEVPDRLVAATAFETLRHLGYLDAPARLHIGPRIDRPVSTQFMLRWEDLHGVTCSAYYKVLHPPHDPPAGWSEATRAALNRAVLLDRRLADINNQEMVRAARVLAVEPDKAAIVTLAVPGRPLTDRIRASWRGGRKPLRDVYLGLGRFIRTIEECTLPDDAPPAVPRRALMQHGLKRVRAILSDDLVMVESLIDRLFEDAVSADKLVHSHADLSPKNILVDGNGVAVIDFGWLPAFSGYDVGYLACRSEYVLQVSTPWAGGLVEALLAGYGEPGLEATPRWLLARIEALLRLIDQQQHQVGPRRMRYWRAVHELRREARRSRDA